MIGNKYKTIIHILGDLLIIIALIFFIPLIFSIYLREGYLLYISFIIPAIIAFFLGIIFIRIRVDKINIDMSTSMILVTLAWVIASFIGSIPFYIGLNKSFIDSLFESASGFTSAGLTVFQNLNQMPDSILLYRSLIQWVGGLGILTFFLLITFRSEGEIWQIFSAESHKINLARPMPNIIKSIEILFGIYLFFTVLQFILLIIFKVDILDAIIHSLTTISTAGFSNYDSSIGYFQESGHPNYKIIEYIIIFFMLMGGINFLIHYQAFKGNVKGFFNNSEIKYYWGLIIGSLVIILFSYYVSSPSFDFANWEEVFRKTLFQVVSLVSTTGYQTESIASDFFPQVARMLFLFLMLIGGCVGSTAGGVKIIRIMVLNKLFLREIHKVQIPKRFVMPVVIDKEIIKTEEIFKIVAIFFAWIILVFLGGGITALFSELSIVQSVSGMLSAVSTIGPSFISVEEMKLLDPIIKGTYIFGMLVGRLEILTVLILFTKKAWK